jgi:uncharacterized cupredoxin-like copper-binding protein
LEEEFMGKRLALFLMIGVMILGALAACGGSSAPPAESPAASSPAASSPAGSAESPAASSPAGSAESPAAGAGGSVASGGTIEIDATEMSFTPNEFTAPANSTFTVKLKNTGSVLHDFTIDKDGSGKKVEIKAEPGAETTTEVKTGPAGTLEFYCAQPGHKDAGMDGHIKVQ